MFIAIKALYIEVKNEKQGEELADKLAKLLYRYDKHYSLAYEYEN